MCFTILWTLCEVSYVAVVALIKDYVTLHAISSQIACINSNLHFQEKSDHWANLSPRRVDVLQIDYLSFSMDKILKELKCLKQLGSVSSREKHSHRMNEITYCNLIFSFR